MITYCEHFGINAVMTYFDARAKEYGIKTDIKLSYPEEMHISQTDLTVIFANFLENAFDAFRYGVEHGKAFKPYIQVKGVYDNGQIITHIKNNMIGKAVVNENNKFMSSKHPGDGVGIDSVRAIVEKYGGILNIEQCSGEFNVYLIV